LQLDVVAALQPRALPAVLIFLFMAVFDAIRDAGRDRRAGRLLP
jgi:hypothetical protein